jgi:hypothetical protein
MTAMNSPVKRIKTGSQGTSDSYLDGTHEFNLEDLNQVLFDIAYDVAGNNNGTSKGATQGANGILGTSAYDFDPSNNDWVDLGKPSHLTDTAFGNSISVSVYFYPRANSGDIVSSGSDSSNDNVRIFHGGGNNTWTGYLQANNGPQLTFGDSVTLNSWNHCTITYNGNTFRLYFNGVELKSTSLSGTLADASGSPWAIGSRGGDSQFFDGRITDVRIYDHALTPAEVQYLYEVSRRGRFVSSKWRK